MRGVHQIPGLRRCKQNADTGQTIPGRPRLRSKFRNSIDLRIPAARRPRSSPRARRRNGLGQLKARMRFL
jgi:hypothetical protein